MMNFKTIGEFAVLDWESKLNEELLKLNTSIEQLFTGPFYWKELSTFLTAVITLAEITFTEPGSGETKTEFVMAIWHYYDGQYNLTKKFDDLVDFRKIVGTVIGTVVEMWDEKIMVMMVEKLLIPFLVGKLFPHQ